MEGFSHLGVSKNNGTPKSSIFIGFSIIFGVPLFLETLISLDFVACYMIFHKFPHVVHVGMKSEISS